MTKSYFYANAQVLTGYKYDGVDVNDVPVIEYKNFHIHDRLGSTRLVVDADGKVKNSRTFTPFGQDLDYSYSRENYFRFTGQWYDLEIGQYYLRARMYDPQLMRFTGRDPVRGKYKEPMSLHKYLYCQNEPINHIDPDGRFGFLLGGSLSGNLTASGLADFGPRLRGLGGLTDLINYSCVLLPAHSILSQNIAIGGTFGAGFVAAKNMEDYEGWSNWNRGWSWGTMQWRAKGVAATTGSGGSLTMDLGISFNAQTVSDFAGSFTEYGGSITGPAPVGSWFFSATGGLTYSVSDTGIDLWTVSGGAAYSGWGWGAEGHRYTGTATVQEW